MNLPLHPDPSLQHSTLERDASAPSSYAPSVPISVYRELAAELQATKAMVDSLNGQNQQLMQQNQVLRQEILRFAQASDRLRLAIESTQPAAVARPAEPSNDYFEEEPDSFPERVSEGSSHLATQPNRPVKPLPSAPQKRPKGSQPPALFTEQRPERLRQGTDPTRTQDMSGLWLATTILLIVVSAFGAGFLIMKPLLGGNK
ncbi:MAG TPA: hypothetical protein V6D29_02910 [Leptolyngbyaceae cyanobacterium]